MGKPVSFDRIMATDYGRAAVQELLVERHTTLEAIKADLDYFDEVGGFSGYGKPVYDNRGRERRHGVVVGYEVIEEGGIPHGWPRVKIKEQIAEAIAEAKWHKELKRRRAAMALDADPVQPRPPKSLSQTPEAIRKRMARAAGKVKLRAPRPRRPPRTLAQEVESRRKSVETRRAKLERTKARQKAENRLDLIYDVARQETGLARAEKALKTFEDRLAAATPRAP